MSVILLRPGTVSAHELLIDCSGLEGSSAPTGDSRVARYGHGCPLMKINDIILHYIFLVSEQYRVHSSSPTVYATVLVCMLFLELTHVVGRQVFPYVRGYRELE